MRVGHYRCHPYGGTRALQLLALAEDLPRLWRAQTWSSARPARALLPNNCSDLLVWLCNKTKYKAQGNQPTFDVPSEMHRILGVDLSAIPGMSAQTALTFFCEVGPQITRFPSSRHFASWLGLCPDNRISGGKILSSKTRNVRCRLANALRMAATTLYRSRSALGDYFRRLRARLGSPGSHHRRRSQTRSRSLCHAP